VLDGEQATPGRLRDTITSLLADPQHSATLAQAAAAHGRPDAADLVINEILTAVAADTR
jgi:UDP-N-acetylglucosamine--N-acetylmuramyl-(pentapeptide) pyrophosphoryl-undecaprenol N-acetylglucosamine transferase